MEDHLPGHRLRFCAALARMAARLWWNAVTAEPLRIPTLALLGWFVYMATGIVVSLGGVAVAPLAATLAELLGPHTGLELLGLGSGGSLGANPVFEGLESVALVTATPFLVGGFAGKAWPDRAVTLWGATLFLWPALAAVAPFAAIHTRVTLGMLPVTEAFLLAGVLAARNGESRTRVRSVRHTSGHPGS